MPSLLPQEKPTRVEPPPREALVSRDQRSRLFAVVLRRRWPLALMLTGWLHLAAFGLCYFLTIEQDYHDSTGYLLIWIAELSGMAAIFRLTGGPRPANLAPDGLELFVRRVWIGYFVLAFNLGSLNTLRGHHYFEFFPAMASLASFAFIVMTVLLDTRFFLAVLVHFAAGLLMAANLLHAYLIFALAWCIVLNGTALALWRQRRTPQPSETA
ncbi:MAG: hypothetical protein U0793_07360 [Gemmataceae bacterium]